LLDKAVPVRACGFASGDAAIGIRQTLLIFLADAPFLKLSQSISTSATQLWIFRKPSIQKLIVIAVTSCSWTRPWTRRRSKVIA